MSPDEISIIKSKRNAAIVAAAGHGKTEMIVDLVEAYDKKVLLVTHTNAGINALKQRLKRRGIDSKKYSITTIAGFCIRWCSAYPKTANVCDMSVTDSKYYSMQYDGTAAIFSNIWARDVLHRTYTCVIVDEYQDCLLSQHQIFLEINKTIPVIAFGDPLQAIFGWAGPLVSWKDLCFEKVSVYTYPWRWKKTNPALGEYLNKIRPSLEPGLEGNKITIPIKAVQGCIQVMPTSCKHNSELISMVQDYEDAVYITKWSKDQEAFSRRTGGIFQNDEAQSLKALFYTAFEFDKRDGHISVDKLFLFLELCATGIKDELGSYWRNIQKNNYNFNRIKKHPEFGILIKAVYDERSNESIIDVLDWVKKEGAFKLYRRELLSEMRRSLICAIEKNITILDAAQRIRTIPVLQRKYPKFKMLSSRTVLSKGLEFDCVIVDLENGMSVTDYYVSLTRAKKQIILISDQETVTLEGVVKVRKKG